MSAVEKHFRDSHWACFEAEEAPVRLVANLAYLGAQYWQVERLVGKKISSTAMRRLYNLLAPNMRRPAGMRRTGGRPKSSRAIKKLPFKVRKMLIGILGDYHQALLSGAEPADARLAAWLVFDSERHAGQYDEDAEIVTLDLWLVFVDFVVRRRAYVSRCATCGAPNIVLDLEMGSCVSGGHRLVDSGPYFLSPDGGDSPMLRDIGA